MPGESPGEAVKDTGSPRGRHRRAYRFEARGESEAVPAPFRDLLGLWRLRVINVDGEDLWHTNRTH